MIGVARPITLATLVLAALFAAPAFAESLPETPRPAWIIIPTGNLQLNTGFLGLDATTKDGSGTAHLAGGPTFGFNAAVEAHANNTPWIPGLLVEYDRWTLVAPEGSTLTRSSFSIYGYGLSLSRRHYLLGARWFLETGMLKKFSIVAASTTELSVQTASAPFYGVKLRWSVPRQSKSQWFIETSGRYVAAKEGVALDFEAGYKLKVESGFSLAWSKGYRSILSAFYEYYQSNNSLTDLSISRIGLSIRTDFTLNPL